MTNKKKFIPKYTLEDLLDKCDFSEPSDEEKFGDYYFYNITPVGREWEFFTDEVNDFVESFEANKHLYPTFMDRVNASPELKKMRDDFVKKHGIIYD